MKKLIAVAIVLISPLAFAADQVILYSEPMVGRGHPTLADTLNRALLIQHGADGVHTVVPYSTLTGVPTTLPYDNLTGTPTTLAGYGITDAGAQDNVAITGGTIDNVTLQGVSSAYYDPTSSIQDQMDSKQDITSILSAIVGGTSSTGVPWNDNGTVTWKGLVDFFALFGIIFNPADNTITFGAEITVPQLNSSGAANAHFINVANATAPNVGTETIGDCYTDNTATPTEWLCWDGDSWELQPTQYDMDQNVQTTDNVTFNVVTAASFASTAADNTRGVTALNSARPTGANLSAGKCWTLAGATSATDTYECNNSDNTAVNIIGAVVKTFSFAIDNVIAGDDMLLWKVPRAISITSVTCVGSTADDIIGVLQECTAADQTSCSDLDSTDWTMTNGAGGTTVAAAALEDAAIAAGAWLKWNTESVEVTNSSDLTCTVQYRE